MGRGIEKKRIPRRNDVTWASNHSGRGTPGRGATPAPGAPGPRALDPTGPRQASAADGDRTRARRDATPDDGSLALPEVVRRCQHGDRDAQRALFERYQHPVFRLVARLAGTEHAGDLTQQVFLRVLERIGQFEGRSTFHTWLYRIAVHEALQFLRKRRRRREVPLVRQEETAVGGPSIDRVMLRELLETALARLDPELRAVFLLRESEGLSYAEIAAVLEIPEGTVGSQLHRARRTLRGIVENLA